MAGWEDLPEPAGQLTTALNYNAEFFNIYAKAIQERAYIKNGKTYNSFDFTTGSIMGYREFYENIKQLVEAYRDIIENGDSDRIADNGRYIHPDVYNNPNFLWKDRTDAQIFLQEIDFENYINDPKAWEIIWNRGNTIHDYLYVGVWNACYKIYELSRYMHRSTKESSSPFRTTKNTYVYAPSAYYSGVTQDYDYWPSPLLDYDNTEVLFNDSCSITAGACPGTPTGSGRTPDEVIDAWKNSKIIQSSGSFANYLTYSFTVEKDFKGYGNTVNEMFLGDFRMTNYGGMTARRYTGSMRMCTAYEESDTTRSNPLSFNVSTAGRLKQNLKRIDLFQYYSWVEIDEWPFNPQPSGTQGDRIIEPLNPNYTFTEYSNDALTGATPMDDETQIIPYAVSSGPIVVNNEGHEVPSQLYSAAADIPDLNDFVYNYKMPDVADLPFSTVSAAAQAIGAFDGNGSYDPDVNRIIPQFTAQYYNQFEVEDYQTENDRNAYHYYVDLNNPALEFNPW